MFRFKLLFLLYSILLFSCTNQPGLDLQPEAISTTVVIQEGIFLPAEMLVHEDLLLITDRSNNPSVSIFQITDEETYKPIKQLGREGRGGGEFLAPNTLLFNKHTNKVYVFDIGGRKLVPINQQLEFETNSEKIIEMNGMPDGIHAISDSAYAITGIFVGARFGLFENTGYSLKETATFGEFEPTGIELNSFHEAAAWRSGSVYSESSQKLVLFNRYANRAELYDLHGNLLTYHESPTHGKPKAEYVNDEFVFSDDAIVSYISVAADNDRIFALYSGKSYNSETSGEGNLVHVFDWDLNLVTILELDHDSISITVDEKSGLYSIQNSADVAIRFAQLHDM
ncbi:MAG: hypothetical protein EA391_14345 [Balneolaceae bacterium]|nr:MAG: hypothetical protein EA391_14345 [Balneolaceae bacterium]